MSDSFIELGRKAVANGCVQKFDFTPEGIAKRGEATVSFWKDVKPIRSPINRAFTNLI